MRRRLYFLLPDVGRARRIVDQLLLALHAAAALAVATVVEHEEVEVGAAPEIGVGEPAVETAGVAVQEQHRGARTGRRHEPAVHGLAVAGDAPLVLAARVEHQELHLRNWRRCDPLRFLPTGEIYRLTLAPPRDLRGALIQLLGALPRHLSLAQSQLVPAAPTVAPEMVQENHLIDVPLHPRYVAGEGHLNGPGEPDAAPLRYWMHEGIDANGLQEPTRDGED